MKRLLFLLIIAVGSLACVRPSAAQTQARTVDAGPVGPLGFRYAGVPDLSAHPPRWADYPVVLHVYQGSPAEVAGLREGDVILKVNGHDGTETAAYLEHAPGTRYTLLVQRGRQQKEISFVLVEPHWADSTWTPDPSPH